MYLFTVSGTEIHLWQTYKASHFDKCILALSLSEADELLEKFEEALIVARRTRRAEIDNELLALEEGLEDLVNEATWLDAVLSSEDGMQKANAAEGS